MPTLVHPPSLLHPPKKRICIGNLSLFTHREPKDVRPMKITILFAAFFLNLSILTSCVWQPVPDLPTSTNQVSARIEDANKSTRTPSPESQPSPTAQPLPPSRNVALDGVARASEGEETAHFAFDGDPATNWNAKNLAAQWIAVTLDDVYLVVRFELVVAQAPAGLTSHVLWL